ncbi:MAG: hypothetical protein N2376_04810 [Clostridia bacterium]|nr:hypothetical protein [Clostridia bacterium]
MDNRLNPNSKVKPIYYYLKESLKFYDMEKPVVAQIIFVIQLAVIFGGYVFAMPYTQAFFKNFEQINTKLQTQLTSGAFDLNFLNSDLYINTMNAFFTMLMIIFAIKALSFLVGLFYGTYYYFGMTHPAKTGLQRAGVFFSRLPKLILFNVLFYIAFYFGIMLLVLTLGVATMIIPIFSVLTILLPVAVLALNTLFLFKDLLIIEFDIGIFRNFKKSLELTKNSKKNIIMNALWPLCISWLISIFAIDINNAMLSTFIASFLEVITIMVSQRLTSLMFLDAASLERLDKKTQPSPEEM